MLSIFCTNCHTPYPEVGAPYRCPKCRGLFDIPQLAWSSTLSPSLPGIWRYRETFGLPADAPTLSLGEGNTPLIWVDAPPAARQVSNGDFDQVALKCEYQNPSGSFKDRGEATLLSFLRARGVTQAVEDSSGNAGASFAAYAARAGVQARVYAPESASGPKLRQIAAYGAEVVTVAGPRSNAAEAAYKEAAQGMPYASHAYLPFNLPGYATLAYELFEQLGQAPGSVLIPAGQGGLLLGAARGFVALQQAGLIAALPRLIGVQARACAPLWALASYGAAGLMWVREAPTLAEGVRVKNPLRGDAVLQAVEASRGWMLAVDEDAIPPARDDLARRGFYVEPTSAIAWSALQQPGKPLLPPVVVVLTGSGLKAGEIR